VSEPVSGPRCCYSVWKESLRCTVSVLDRICCCSHLRSSYDCLVLFKKHNIWITCSGIISTPNHFDYLRWYRATWRRTSNVTERRAYQMLAYLRHWSMSSAMFTRSFVRNARICRTLIWHPSCTWLCVGDAIWAVTPSKRPHVSRPTAWANVLYRPAIPGATNAPPSPCGSDNKAFKLQHQQCPVGFVWVVCGATSHARTHARTHRPCCVTRLIQWAECGRWSSVSRMMCN
jgi:hypothetical protein